MPRPKHIATILIVTIRRPGLREELRAHGYVPIEVADIASIARVDKPYSLTLIDESLFNNGNPVDLERLYLNNTAPVAILIADPMHIAPALAKLLADGTLDWIHSADIDAGLLCGRIDRMIIGARINETSQVIQEDLREKERLIKEINLRDHLLDHERDLNANITGSITSGLIIIDLKGNVIMLNENARTLLNLSAGDYLGSPFTKVFHGKMRSAVEDFLKRVYNRPLHHEIKKINIDRTVVEIALYQMRDYHQNVNGVLLLVNDITEQENTTKQLYRAEKLATMGTMLSGIAHELRNPLAIISARAQMALAKDAWEREWIVKSFQSIEAQTYRCATIINNLLDFTRYRATQMALHSVEAILNETLTYVEYQNSFDSITIEKQYQPDLVIYGDRSRFVQVFLNIISNASDAMNGTGVLTLKSRPEDKGAVVVEINDNGAGIDGSIRDKIFDPFFTTKEPGKGTGLGLAVVQKIIHESGGEVWFSSTPGSTSFFVKFPTGMPPS